MAGEKTIYKILIFLKRRDGTTPEELRAYYESKHVPLCMKYMMGVVRYRRRYISPLPLPGTGVAPEMEFDVITELWFENEAIYKGLIDVASRGVFPEEVIADELNVFDRSKIRYATLIECETDVTQGRS